MFELSLTTLGLVIVLCVLLHWLLFRDPKYSPPLPPSPYGRLPVIGHIWRIGVDPRQALRKLKKECGNIYRLKLGSKDAVVISGYNAIKEAFKTNGDQFPLRPRIEIFDQLTNNMGIVGTNGPEWQEHRRFTLKTLRDFGMGKSKLQNKIHEQVTELLEEIGTLSNQPFDPKTLISAHVANIICSMSFGMNFQYTDERFTEILRRFDENLQTVVGAATFFPWLINLPGDPIGTKKVIQNSGMVQKYCQDIVMDHVKSYDENNIDDLTSAYIQEMKRLESAGEKTTMNYEFLACVIGDLFVAGSESTTTTLRWAIVAMVNHPEVQEKLFNEIQKNIGTSRLPSVHDKTSLKYVEAFYCEVLRYCILNPIGVFRCSDKDTVVMGYTIPAGYIVLPEHVSLLQDPEVWGDPEKFRPERFLDEEGNLQNNDTFLPFFMGKRSCIGESLARMELFLFIASLVQRFKFENPPGENLTIEKVDGVFGAVHQPKPFKIVAVPRG